MELRQFRYFLAVAEELHFGAAATKVCVSQPALSRQIRDLEIEIGADLIDRRGRCLRLTSVGCLFADHAKRILQNIDSAVIAIRRAARDEVEGLRIGMAGELAARHLGPIIQAWRATQTTMNIELCAITASEQHAALRAGKVDLGFAPGPFPDDTVISQPLWHGALMIALPAGHPLASCQYIDLAELVDTPILLSTLDPGLYALSERLLDEARIGADKTQATHGIAMTLSFVAAGVGAAIVPESASQNAPDGVSLVPLRSPKAKFEIGLIHRAGETSPAVLSFVEIAKEVVRQRLPRTARPPRPRAVAKPV